MRKGERKTQENKPGKDLTYFRFTSEGDMAAAQLFHQAYPDQEALRNINVFLPYQTTDENIDAWIEEWVAGGLVHRCDGRICVLWRKPDGSYSLKTRPCENCKGKQVGRLSVIVPELGRLATITVLTTSIHDIMNLTKQLRSYESFNGDLRGIPFVIRRRPKSISTPRKNGKRVRQEKWLLSIETQPQWTALQFGAMERAALPAGTPFSEDEEGEIVAEIPIQLEGISDPFDESEEFNEPDLCELDKVQFFSKVKDNLGVSPAIAGWIVVKAGLVNGEYNPGNANEMWEAISTQGPTIVQFADKVKEQIRFFGSDAEVMNTVKELAVDLSDPGAAFDSLQKYASEKKDWLRFAQSIIDQMAAFSTTYDVETALGFLGLEYGAESEEVLLEELAAYAEKLAA